MAPLAGFLSSILCSLCRASALGPSASSAALSAILSLPSRFLIHDRGGKRGFQTLRGRLSRPLSTPASFQPVGPTSTSSRVSPFASRIARAKALLERGHISRATRCLFQRGLAPLVSSTVESLRKLHPPALPCLTLRLAFMWMVSF